MKKEFERIWNDPKCRMPLNLIWWHDEEFGYKEVDGLWYSKGKLFLHLAITGDGQE